MSFFGVWWVRARRCFLLRSVWQSCEDGKSKSRSEAARNGPASHGGRCGTFFFPLATQCVLHNAGAVVRGAARASSRQLSIYTAGTKTVLTKASKQGGQHRDTLYCNTSRGVLTFGEGSDVGDLTLARYLRLSSMGIAPLCRAQRRECTEKSSRKSARSTLHVLFWQTRTAFAAHRARAATLFHPLCCWTTDCRGHQLGTDRNRETIRRLWNLQVSASVLPDCDKGARHVAFAASFCRSRRWNVDGE